MTCWKRRGWYITRGAETNLLDDKGQISVGLVLNATYDRCAQAATELDGYYGDGTGDDKARRDRMVGRMIECKALTWYLYSSNYGFSDNQNKTAQQARKKVHEAFKKYDEWNYEGYLKQSETHEIRDRVNDAKKQIQKLIDGNSAATSPACRSIVDLHAMGIVGIALATYLAAGLL